MPRHKLIGVFVFVCVLLPLSLFMWGSIGVGYASYLERPIEPQPTWVDKLPDYPIPRWPEPGSEGFPVQIGNGGLKTVKHVTDVLTGDQAYVVGKPWVEHGRQCYRILRESRTTIRIYVEKKEGGNPAGMGWVEEKRIADTWVVETRTVDELTPGPSA